MTPPISLDIATATDLSELLPLVEAFHAHEGISLSDERRRAALRPLLMEGAAEGRIWLVRTGGSAVGYVAVCFGYSIEFGGRDAFVDELFVVAAMRGRGIGRAVMEALRSSLREHGVAALHLEVNRGNPAAHRLYRRAGFALRERYCLMSLRLD